MIRIDEIYCNTFLPSMQDRPNHGLHWFDPFGSTNFYDLCNVPPIENSEATTRFLFWDQEPLHKETVDCTLSKFVDMFYLGQRHLVVSEKQSEFVDYACDTYGFKPHYYFFHGWASLDWFRGYDYSFLIRPAESRTIKKTFLAPNRIIAGARTHRIALMYHFIKNNLTHNHISFPEVCPSENISVDQALNTLLPVYPDIKTVFAKQPLPLQFANEVNHPMQSYRLDLFEQSQESLLYVVTETVAQGKRLHLTEKTFKPICLRMPFILVSTAGSLEYLKSYGFKTFSSLWDESYDQEIDDVARLQIIAKLLKQLDDQSPKEKQQLFLHAQQIVDFNFNHFYKGDFVTILWNELNDMTRKMYV